jgi:hypothetical protein
MLLISRRFDEACACSALLSGLLIIKGYYLNFKAAGLFDEITLLSLDALNLRVLA